MSVFLVYVFSGTLGLAGPNTTGRFLLMKTIYETGETSFPYAWVDEYGLFPDFARLGDRAFSDKAPGVSLLLLPVYSLARGTHAALGSDAGPASRAADELAIFFCLLVVIAVSAWAVVRMFDLARWLGAGEHLAVGIAALFAFGTHYWGYAPTFFPHALVTSILIEATYRLLAGGARQGGSAALVLSGLLFGVAGVVDYPAIFLAPAAALYLLATAPAGSRLAAVGRFGVGCAVGVAPLFVYNAVTFGGPLDLAYDYSHWHSRIHFYNPLHEGLWLLVFSSARGVLNVAPVLAFSAVGFFQAAKRWPAEAWLFASFVSIPLFFYAKNFDPAGGLGYGPRYIVMILPFLLLPLAAAQPLLRNRAFAIGFGIAALASVAANFLGLWATHRGPLLPVTERHPVWDVCLGHFLAFLQGDMATFRSSLFRIDPSTAIVVLALGCVALGLAFRNAEGAEPPASRDERRETDAGRSWPLQAIYLPVFALGFLFVLSPRMSRGFDAMLEVLGRAPVGPIERVFGQPLDAAVALAAICATYFLLARLRALRFEPPREPSLDAGPNKESH